MIILSFLYYKKGMSKSMNVKGKKVLLRAMELEDMEFLRNMINDEDMEHNVIGWSFPVSRYEQQKWFENTIQNKNNIRFIVETEGKSIGLATLTSIDWKNRKACHGIKLFSDNIKGKGYGTDTVMTIMKYAFEELQLNRLYGSILEYNTASRRLYEKCGWKEEGIERKSIFKNNQYHDEIVLGVLKEDYEEKKREWM